MVSRVFRLMYKEVRGLHQAAYILALFAIGSQLLAIVRDRLLAHTFGAGSELDLYYAAFRIPDILFVVFASVLSVYVLLPFVNERPHTRILSQLFTLFLLSYSGVALVLGLLAPWYVPLIFPGLAENSDTLTLLLQLLLLQPFLLGISSLCGVITQLNHRFVLYAISPLLYNVGIIFGVVALYPVWGLPGVVGGVVIGALGHLTIQWPFVEKSQWPLRVVRQIVWADVRAVLALAIPRASTLAVQQVVLLILISFATVMTAGSVAVFQFAFNLQSVPLAIIGMSYSVAAFPTLSRLSAEKNHTDFNRQLLVALRHILFWSVPVIVLVIVLRAQIVRVLLGSGMFDWSDTRLTAAVLAVFVSTLVLQAALLLLVRAFYATGRVRLPLIAACLGAITTVTLAWWWVSVFQTMPEIRLWTENVFRLTDVPGTEVLVLALTFAVGVVVQGLVLLLGARQTFVLSFRELGRLFGHASLAAIVGGMVAYGTLAFIVDGVNQNTFLGIALQGLVAGIAGVIAVIGVYHWCQAPELSEIYRSFHAKIFKTNVVAPQPDAL